MRPDYDGAVLRRANMASLQVWTQTALRVVLLLVLLWALLTTGPGLVLDGLLRQPASA